jgi:Ala-tRNA(Pro) deacylase
MICMKVFNYLRAQGVPFTQQQHHIAYTAQEVAESEHLSGDMVAKVVIVSAGPQLLMLVLPASHRADLTKVAAAVGARDICLADEHELAEVFPDCDVGTMPPFGNLYGVPVYIDRHLAEPERIVFQAGTHTDTIEMAYADYAHLVNPEVVEIARDTRVLVVGV